MQQGRTKGNREKRQTVRAILSVWGHDAIGPNGVHDQSFSLLSSQASLVSLRRRLSPNNACRRLLRSIPHFGAPDQRAQLSAGREPFRGQITLFGRMACGLDFAQGTTVHCGGSRHQALSGFFGLVVGLVRWWRRAGSVVIVIVEAMDAEGLLEAGQHEALQPLGGVVQEAGLDQRFGELVERVHLIVVRQVHHHPLQHLQHALCPSCRFRTRCSSF